MIPTLILTNSIVEVLENLFLSNQPYLVRITSWNQNIEIRVNDKELKQLGKFFINLSENAITNDDEDTVY